jgi:nucleoside-diphosphate-sugar epimerase
MGGGRLLVTGAAGFTGRHLLKAARARGYECIALYRPGDVQVPAADASAAVDLADGAQLSKVVARFMPDVVAHLAAAAFVGQQDVSDLYTSNLVGTVNLLTAVEKARVSRILLVSSANLYGNSRELPITEETPVEPLNHYGVSKWAMERAAELFSNAPRVVVRPFNYTGVGQSERFVVAKIVSAYRRGERALKLGNLAVARDFSDVRDVVEAYLRLLEHPQPLPLYNVCSGKAVSLEALLQKLEKIVGYPMEIEADPALMRRSDIAKLYGDPTRLERTIGTYRRHDLEDTLRWMYAGEPA